MRKVLVSFFTILILASLSFFLYQNWHKYFDLNRYFSRFNGHVQSGLAHVTQLEVSFQTIEWKDVFKGRLQLQGVFLKGLPDSKALEIYSDQLEVDFSAKGLLSRKINIKKLIFKAPRIQIQKSYRETWNPFHSTSDFSHDKEWEIHLNRFDFVDAQFEVMILQEYSETKYALKNTSVILEKGDGNDDAKTVIWRIEGMGNVQETSDIVNFIIQYDWEKDSGTILLNYGDEELTLEGNYNQLRRLLHYEGNATLNDRKVRTMHFGNYLSLGGKVKLHGEFFVEGYNKKDWFQSMRSQGSLIVSEGFLSGVNPFDSLKKIIIKEYPPVENKPTTSSVTLLDQSIFLFQKELPFTKLQADYVLDRDHLILPDLLIESQDYILDLKGDLSMSDERVEFYGESVLLGEAVRVWTAQFDQFQFEINQKERLVLPINYRGTLPFAQFDTDHDYLDAIYKHEKSQAKLEEDGAIDLMTLTQEEKHG